VYWANEPCLQWVIVPRAIEPCLHGVLLFWAIEPSLQGSSCIGSSSLVSKDGSPRSPRVLGQRAKSPMGSRAYGHRAKSPRGPFLGPTSQVSKMSVSWANEPSLMGSRASVPVYKGLVSWANEPSLQEVFVSWAIEPSLQGALVSWAIEPLRLGPHPHPTPPNQHHHTPPHLAPRLCRCIRRHCCSSVLTCAFSGSKGYVAARVVEEKARAGAGATECWRGVALLLCINAMGRRASRTLHLGSVGLWCSFANALCR
jgi:hypothetical protein